MRITFLNCWQGKKMEDLLGYFRTVQNDADIYCIQENVEPLKLNLDKIFSDYNSYITLDEKWDYIIYGKSIYFKKGIKLISKGKVRLYERGGKESPGSFLYLEILYDNKKLMILNVHGKSFPGDKMDSSERIRQSQIILDFVKKHEGSIIFGGDFNLLPGTNCIKMLEKGGYRNLISEYGIKQTRNELAWEFYQNEPGYVKQYYSDYVFVSNNVKVTNFEVPNILVSDHNPMVLEFEL